MSIDRFEFYVGGRSAGDMRLYSRLGYGVFKRVTPEKGPLLVLMEKRQ